MIRILLAALALACTAPALAQSCRPLAAVEAALPPILDPVKGNTIVLIGPDAVAYLAALNATPPQTHLAGDGVVLALVPGADATLWIIRIGMAVHGRAMDAVRAHQA